MSADCADNGRQLFIGVPFLRDLIHHLFDTQSDGARLGRPAPFLVTPICHATLEIRLDAPTWFTSACIWF